MAQSRPSFGFAARMLLLLIVAGVIAVVVVAIYGARETPTMERGAMGPLGGGSPERATPLKAP